MRILPSNRPFDRRNLSLVAALLLMVGLFVVRGRAAGPVRLFFQPSLARVPTNSELILEIRVDTSGRRATAARASFQYPTDLLSFKQIDANDSAFNIEITSQNNNGVVTIERRRGTGSVTGNLLLARVKFQVAEANQGQEAKLAFDEASFIQSDQGDDILEVTEIGTYYLIEPDTVPPDAPTELFGEVLGPRKVELKWQAANDNVGVTRYQIRRRVFNGSGGYQPVGEVYSAVTSFIDTTVEPSSVYAYRVYAIDGSDNETPSNAASVRTLPPPDRKPPDTPTISQAVASTPALAVVTAASNDNVRVAGYEFYRDGQLLTVQNAQTLDDRTARPGNTHVYTVKAFDEAGNRSLPSAATIAMPSDGGRLARLYLKTTSDNISRGEQIAVEVRLDSGSNQVNFVQQFLNYSNTVWRFDGMTRAGSAFNQLTHFKTLPTTIEFGLRKTGTPVSGDALVVVFKFTAITDAGSAHLWFAEGGGPKDGEAGAKITRASDGVNIQGEITGGTYTVGGGQWGKFYLKPPTAVNYPPKDQLDLDLRVDTGGEPVTEVKAVLPFFPSGRLRLESIETAGSAFNVELPSGIQDNYLVVHRRKDGSPVVGDLLVARLHYKVVRVPPDDGFRYQHFEAASVIARADRANIFRYDPQKRFNYRQVFDAATDSAAPIPPNYRLYFAERGWITVSLISLEYDSDESPTGVRNYIVQRRQGNGPFETIERAFTPPEGWPDYNWVDRGLTPGTSYTYRFAHRDYVGNVSGWSYPITVTLPAKVDKQPPGSPASVIARSPGGRQVNLIWSPASDNDVGADLFSLTYEIYRNNSRIATVRGVRLDDLIYSDRNLQPGTYTYTIQARDRGGNLGPASTPKTVTVN